MKKLAMMAAVVCVAGAASAAYFIDYTSYWGTAGPDGSTGVIPNGGDVATLQLLYAGADGIANEAAPGELSIGSLVTGDDVLLYETTFVNGGGLYQDFAAGSFGTFDGAAYLGGKVYGRIFSSDTISVGDSYFIGAVVDGFNDLDSAAVPAPLPQGYDLAPDALTVASGTVVPEPATLGLMGVAGLGMFLARRKARR